MDISFECRCCERDFSLCISRCDLLEWSQNRNGAFCLRVRVFHVADYWSGHSAETFVWIAKLEFYLGGFCKKVVFLSVNLFLLKGWGLYTQIVAAVWAFLAWGQSVDYVIHGTGFLRASVFLALSWLSHLIVGYGVSAITIVLVLGVLREGMPEKAVYYAFARWLALNLTTALLISYLIVPTLVEAHVLNRSRFEPAEYWDSYGAETCLKWLFKGALLDRVYSDGPWAPYVGNAPVFTVTVLCGVVLIAIAVMRDLMFEKRGRLSASSRTALLLLAGCGVAFLLFTGRSTFGPVLKLVPFAHSLPFHRFFVHFHMFAILIAGWMLHQICRMIVWTLKSIQLLAWTGPLICVALILVLVVKNLNSLFFLSFTTKTIHEGVSCWCSFAKPHSDTLS
jgi:hypothetical protein